MLLTYFRNHFSIERNLKQKGMVENLLIVFYGKNINKNLTD